MSALPIRTEHTHIKQLSRKYTIIALINTLIAPILLAIFFWGISAVQVNSNYRTVAEALSHGEDLGYIPYFICAVLSLVTLVVAFIYSLRGTLAMRAEGNNAWGWFSVALLVLTSLAAIVVVLPTVFGLIVALFIALSQ